jgi:outer membrane protein TolC
MYVKRRVCAGLAALSVAGCGVGPRYHAPVVDVPPAFTSPVAAAPAEIPPTDWWRGFGVPELDRLIDQAAKASPDVQAAAARIIPAPSAKTTSAAPTRSATSAI